MIKAINKQTGEIIELPTDSLNEFVTAWRIAQEYEKVAKSLKEQLKKSTDRFLDEKGKSEEVDGHRFTSYPVEKKTYDKSVLKEVIKDEDLLDEMLQPNKKFIDEWLKDNVETTGEVGVRLRKTMIPAAQPFMVVKLEKVSRDN